MEQAVRDEFEAAYPLPDGMERNGESYTGGEMWWLWEERWQVWQRSRAALRVELPPSVTIEEVAEHLGMDDVEVVDIAHMVNGAIAACAAFIKQAGIEVK
ncbi:TPA: hypothetical protein NIA80_005282 [Pseudomonas aeruginosa]|nr:hypothetical protein [Pseudomonas aeruginosa]HCE7441649.1 hypothetical protein [Pseudomonas aeruginosa]HCE7856630.1 hypothetical protein [Pseudomonas aeruginosa]HCE7878266.1 hypothetical protein [Pseudomonas aeruginosa]HCE7894473.1 hypothetical protein [Pseudomonas aeruginosa]